MEHLKDDERIYLVAECEGDVAGSCVFFCSFETADLCNVDAEDLQRHYFGKPLNAVWTRALSRCFWRCGRVTWLPSVFMKSLALQ